MMSPFHGDAFPHNWTFEVSRFLLLAWNSFQQTVRWPVIWDTSTFMWLRCNELWKLSVGSTSRATIWIDVTKSTVPFIAFMIMAENSYTGWDFMSGLSRWKGRAVKRTRVRVRAFEPVHGIRYHMVWTYANRHLYISIRCIAKASTSIIPIRSHVVCANVSI